MRKHFTLIAGMLFGACTYGSAQTLWMQDFESATGTALPTGWTNVSDPTGGWITKTGATAWNGGQITIPGRSRYAVVDDFNTATAKNDSSFLVSPSFDMSAQTGVWVSMDYVYAGVYRTQTKPEQGHILVSTDNGVNWTTLQALPPKGAWGKGYFSLAGVTSATTKIAVRYKDAGDNLFGIAVDDVRVFVPFANDIRIDSLNFPHLTLSNPVASNGTQVKMSVFNNTGAAITSVDAKYTINGGTPVTETFTVNIAAFTASQLTFTTALAALPTGTADIEVEITGVNGGTDANTADNKKSATLVVATGATTRPCLIEEFTSSTCVPCASFNAFFDPLIESYNVNTPAANFNIIKYQMNWPSPGNDRSYNNYGMARRAYYGVNSIPDHYTYGWPGGDGSQAEIDACIANNMSFMTLDATYTVKGDSVVATVELDPLFTIGSTNHSLHVATVEHEYTNPTATTSQSRYLHVMRELLTGNNGASIASYTAGTTMNYRYAKKYTSANTTATPPVYPTQGSSMFWTNPKNSSLVVFVQDNSTKAILQSFVVAADYPTTVEEKTAGVQKVDLAPNPVSDNTNLLFTLDKASDVQVYVVDAMGRVASVKEVKGMTAGFHTMPISTSELASGLYTIKIQTQSGAVMHRLSVVK